jgi:hypothetical protein
MVQFRSKSLVFAKADLATASCIWQARQRRIRRGTLGSTTEHLLHTLSRSRHTAPGFDKAKVTTDSNLPPKSQLQLAPLHHKNHRFNSSESLLLPPPPPSPSPLCCSLHTYIEHSTPHINVRRHVGRFWSHETRKRKK